MLDRFLEFIKKHALIQNGDRLLLAVSGGVDSMVLLHLFKQTEYPFGIAYCNFQLRGQQADLDEELVESVAQDFDVPFHGIRFGTKEYAQENGISTQMAARELRFNWFSQLCEEFEYDKIVLAHHSDDSIETFFLNLSRGTSLRGLRGIQPQNDRLIRPLLPFSKEELLVYARENEVVWREDASNQDTYYKRNLIRHELLPVFRKLNPDFEKVMSENLEKLDSRFRSSQKIYDRLIKELIVPIENSYQINLQALKSKCESAYDLYEVLRDFQFNYSTVTDLYRAIGGHAVGKVFKSERFDLQLDRESLMISSNKKQDAGASTLSFDSMASPIAFGNLRLEAKLSDIAEWKLDTHSANGAFDFEKLQFPLQVRYWQHGDSFQPLGMRGSKLVSDLLIDLKVPLAEKSGVSVLLSNDEIAWVIGFRISEKFKVTENTQMVWELKSSKTNH